MRPAVAAASVVLLGVAGGLVGCSSQSFEDPEVAFTTVEDADESDKAAADDEPTEAPDSDDDSDSGDDEGGSGAAPAKDDDSPRDDAPRSGGNNSNDSRFYSDVGIGASNPACDGRYILIVDSIVDDPSLGDTRTRINSALVAGPEKTEYMVPGQCDSLRASRHGFDIYPIYVDYGQNVDAACSAKARYGGNVRPLRNGNFGDGTNVDVDEARLALDPC